VQGALVEVVDDEHRGKSPRRLSDLYRSSGSWLTSLLWTSILMGVGVGLGLLLLIVPGILLAIRWAVAAPVVVLEGLGARAAMRRSQELVQGHRKDVFRVLANIWVRTGVAWIACSLLIVGLASGTSHPLLAAWLGAVLASALVTPYAAHALNVVYYRLTDPDQPILPDREPGWQSIWREEDPANP
jgi:Membrane domain of glycerophosphoryl diester phosphodiesterase